MHYECFTVEYSDNDVLNLVIDHNNGEHRNVWLLQDLQNGTRIQFGAASFVVVAFLLSKLPEL